MITMEEILKGKDLDSQSDEIKANLAILLERINNLRKLFGRPMIVTSGLRNTEDMLRIYAEKGVRDRSQIPMKSRHLSGEAVDISDPNHTLTDFVKSLPEDKIKDLELWYEDNCVGWLHCQIIPPKSGRRWFIP